MIFIRNYQLRPASALFSNGGTQALISSALLFPFRKTVRCPVLIRNYVPWPVITRLFGNQMESKHVNYYMTSQQIWFPRASSATEVERPGMLPLEMVKAIVIVLGPDIADLRVQHNRTGFLLFAACNVCINHQQMRVEIIQRGGFSIPEKINVCHIIFWIWWNFHFIASYGLPVLSNQERLMMSFNKWNSHTIQTSSTWMWEAKSIVLVWSCRNRPASHVKHCANCQVSFFFPSYPRSGKLMLKNISQKKKETVMKLCL